MVLLRATRKKKVTPQAASSLVGKSGVLSLRVDEGPRAGMGVAHLVVVHDDRLHAEASRPVSISAHVRRAAVEADEKVDALLPSASLLPSALSP